LAKIGFIKIWTSLLLLVFSSYLWAEVIAFENVNVIPMDQKRILYNYRVLVDDGKINAIEPMTKNSVLKPDRIIDCQGKYMMPGLTDAHYHLRGAQNEKDFELLYKLLLANGITSVVSMGEDAGQDAIAVKAHANKKDVLAPVYFTAGPFLGSEQLKTPKDAIEAVNYHKERGYDFIKVHEDFPLDTYLTLLNEAEKAGIPVVGHAQRALPLEYTLRLSLIAHMEEIVDIFSDTNNFKIIKFNERQVKDIAAQVKNSGVYISPTLIVLAMIQDYRNDTRFEKLKNRPETRYLSKAEYKNYTTEGKEYRQEIFSSAKGIEAVDALIKGTQQLTEAFYKAGVPMLVGSDNIGLQITGFSFHDEMEAMQKAGMSSFDILNAAIVLSARYLKRQAIAGTISVGKNAEFILLSKNPLADIRHTRDVQGVMLKGKWLDKTTINQFLVDVDAARKLEHDD
jgi:imidazolonepropionase-like amidohydrolase